MLENVFFVMFLAVWMMFAAVAAYIRDHRDMASISDADSWHHREVSPLWPVWAYQLAAWVAAVAVTLLLYANATV